jgi:hypothetical protein
MYIPPKLKHENDSIKQAFVATSIALYLQACHLQYEEEADAVMLSFLIANVTAGQPGSTSGNQTGAGNSGQGNPGNSGDDGDSDDTNLGSSMVNNTGNIPADSEMMDAENKDVPRKDAEATMQAAEAEDVATTSPGGTGENRIIGGTNPEGEIDWTGAVDKGSKDADAATG